MKKPEEIKRGWISVDERLPEMNTCVLVAADGGVDIAYYCDIGWMMDTLGNEPVTHWMPLPEPPEEE